LAVELKHVGETQNKKAGGRGSATAAAGVRSGSGTALNQEAGSLGVAGVRDQVGRRLGGGDALGGQGCGLGR